MHIKEYLNYEKLAGHVMNGYVHAQKHQAFPLVLFSYSRKTVYERLWDDVTTKCRGLITTYDGEIIARPFEKFFNINESDRPETHSENLPKPTPIITEKLDGSLGILYRYQGVDYIATKGSFHSEHAEWATQWYHKHVIHPVWPEGYTPIFEIICQTVQHHVVHYTEDGLRLIALINLDTGEELSYNHLYHWAHINGLDVPKVFCEVKQNEQNAEGYVLSWPSQGKPPLKIKFKFPDFLRKQKIMHSTGPKQIFEMLRNGDSFDPIIEDSSEDFANWVIYWRDYLMTLFKETLCTVADIYNSALIKLGNASRKEYAEYFLLPEHKPFSGALFAMLDEDPSEINLAIWKKVQPYVSSIEPFSSMEEEDEE